MVKIRQVREEELDEMLTCMTTAFGVPKEAWADGFYNGLYSDLKWKRVAVADGKVVSCLAFIPSEIYLGGVTIPMGGIAGVATLPEERRHGYAGLLMQNSIHALRELGFAVSALYPFSYKYYRKFGWEFAGHWLKYSIKPELLPSYKERSFVRPFVAEDLPKVMEIYDHHYKKLSGLFVRDEPHWKRHILDGRSELKLVYDNGGVEGYMLARNAEEEGVKKFSVLEIIAATDEARRGLVGFLAKESGKVDQISIQTSKYDLESLGLLEPRAHWEDGNDPRCEIRVTPSFQFRIIDLYEAMRILLGRLDNFGGALSILMHDEIGKWNNTPITIRESGISLEKTDTWLKADVRFLSQLFMGYLSPKDAFSQGMIEVSDSQALDLAEQLFPQSEPFITTLNEF